MSAAKKNKLLLAMCFLAYSVSYIGKYSYSTNIANVIAEFGISKSYAGYVTSAFFFLYGIGQIINAVLCDRLDSRVTVSSSLLISGMITLTMYFTSDVLAMAILWGINGLVLSSMWCHSIKLLATIQDKRYMTRSVTAMSITLPVGVVSAYGLGALFTYLSAWRLNYIFSSVLLILMAIIFYISVGRIGVSEMQSATEPVIKQSEQGKGLFSVFGIMAIPLLLTAICAGVLRDGSSTWMPVLLKEKYSLPDFFSILLTLGLPLMGVFTAVISTRLIKVTRGVFGSCLAAGAFALIITAALSIMTELSFVWLVILFMLLSVAGYVLSNTITSILPLFYKGRLGSGRAAGITNACVYLGSTLSSFCLGGVVDAYGWRMFMMVLLAVSILVVISSVLGTFFGHKKVMPHISG